MTAALGGKVQVPTLHGAPRSTCRGHAVRQDVPAARQGIKGVPLRATRATCTCASRSRRRCGCRTAEEAAARPRRRSPIPSTARRPRLDGPVKDFLPVADGAAANRVTTQTVSARRARRTGAPPTACPASTPASAANAAVRSGVASSHDCTSLNRGPYCGPHASATLLRPPAARRLDDALHPGMSNSASITENGPTMNASPGSPASCPNQLAAGLLGRRTSQSPTAARSRPRRPARSRAQTSQRHRAVTEHVHRVPLGVWISVRSPNAASSRSAAANASVGSDRIARSFCGSAASARTSDNVRNAVPHRRDAARLRSRGAGTSIPRRSRNPRRHRIRAVVRAACDQLRAQALRPAAWQPGAVRQPGDDRRARTTRCRAGPATAKPGAIGDATRVERRRTAPARRVKSAASSKRCRAPSRRWRGASRRADAGWIQFAGRDVDEQRVSGRAARAEVALRLAGLQRQPAQPIAEQTFALVGGSAGDRGIRAAEVRHRQVLRAASPSGIPEPHTGALTYHPGVHDSLARRWTRSRAPPGSSPDHGTSWNRSPPDLLDCRSVPGIQTVRLRRGAVPVSPPARRRRRAPVTRTWITAAPAGARARRLSGPICASEATVDLAAILLRDSAHLQPGRRVSCNRRGFSRHADASRCTRSPTPARCGCCARSRSASSRSEMASRARFGARRPPAQRGERARCRRARSPRLLRRPGGARTTDHYAARNARVGRHAARGATATATTPTTAASRSSRRWCARPPRTAAPC